MDFLQPPVPLTPRQRAIFWVVAVVCAASRFLALARTLWDWDEALFCLGMREYDVTSHHPHPPGFPVYIAAAKLLRTFIADDFRALQAVNLIAAVCVFPAIFFLARELKFRFVTATIAAALCAFFPNVWFFGGTAFSDVPSLVLAVFAVAMLFRGCRDANAYFIGTLLLALAIGIRPQNLLLGLFPGLLATWYRARASWRDVVFAALIGTAVVAVAFGSAVIATGPFERYMETVRSHGDYISRVDSWRNADRPPLWRISDRFFMKQYQAPVLNVVMTIFVLISLAGSIRSRSRAIGYAALTFMPFAVAAWLMLDRFSINRFSIGYIPLFALMGADGIARVAWKRRELEPAIGIAVVVAFIFWTLPALHTVRTEIAPSVAVVEAAKKIVDPKHDQLFVGFSMTPFVEYLAPYQAFIVVMDERALPMSAGNRKAYLLTEIDRTDPYGYIFRREKGHLWNIARRHYFVTALEPMRFLPRFVSGWHDPERAGTGEFRWMKGHSVTVLPPASGETYLRLLFDVPDEVIPLKPVVTITLNGKVVDQFVATTTTVTRDLHVDAAPGNASNTLELDINHIINPVKQRLGDDGRDLGLLVRWISWGKP